MHHTLGQAQIAATEQVPRILIQIFAFRVLQPLIAAQPHDDQTRKQGNEKSQFFQGVSFGRSAFGMLWAI